jgi:CheY-like chemotaxis protein
LAIYNEFSDDIRVVLCDTDMPVMDGEAMIRTLKILNPHVRIISASGLAEHAGPGESVAGAHVVLPKPYTAAELLRAVRNVIAS